jgi:hypothetical protein
MKNPLPPVTPARLALVFAIVLASLDGCGVRASPRAPEAAQTRDLAPQTTAEDLTAPEGELRFAAIRLFNAGEVGLVLAVDGTVVVPGRGLAGRLERDGRFVDASDRTLIELTPKGEFVLPNGDYLPVTMDRDGAVHLLKEARVVRLHDDGSLEGTNPSGPAVRVEGATPSTRRTAMFLLVLVSYPMLSRS